MKRSISPSDKQLDGLPAPRQRCRTNDVSPSSVNASGTDTGDREGECKQEQDEQGQDEQGQDEQGQDEQGQDEQEQDEQEQDEQEQDEHEQDEQEDQPCVRCGASPCLWIQVGDDVLESMHAQFDGDDTTPHNEKCKFCYRTASNLIHGILGVGNRRQHSECVVLGIRRAIPSPDSTYMGYMPN